MKRRLRCEIGDLELLVDIGVLRSKVLPLGRPRSFASAFLCAFGQILCLVISHASYLLHSIFHHLVLYLRAGLSITQIYDGWYTSPSCFAIDQVELRCCNPESGIGWAAPLLWKAFLLRERELRAVDSHEERLRRER